MISRVAAIGLFEEASGLKRLKKDGEPVTYSDEAAKDQGIFSLNKNLVGSRIGANDPHLGIEKPIKQYESRFTSTPVYHTRVQEFRAAKKIYDKTYRNKTQKSEPMKLPIMTAVPKQ